VVLSAEGHQFALGPARKTWADPVAPQYLFVPEEGDVVSFTRQEGRVKWWSYARLLWTKRSGGVLEITWRDGQDLYRSGWMDTFAARLAKVQVQ
jgi:hypothetical protein